MNDDQYRLEYSGLNSADRAVIAALADSAEQDDMDRFQDPDNGWAYRITVDFDMASKLEAQMLADIVRDVVRRHEERVPCPVCHGRRWIGGSPQSRYSLPPRRCTVCKDGTVVSGGPARVMFEAHSEPGSEALLPRFAHPSYSGVVVEP